MKRVVFLCVENSNRSQMAEACARLAGGVEAFSAGSRPSGKVNPQAIASMCELGYDLTAHRSKSVEELPAGSFDVVVSMGCGDRCPHLQATRREDWNIPDPKGLPTDEFRKVRDLIRTKVDQLLIDLQGADHVDRNEGH
jgi:protein-tyrosine-phosphatase